MKRYFAYIRVSTVKQGERGSSLQEQKSAIEAFASRRSLEIAGWFEERETAAKEGRRVFTRMLAELARGAADGIIIHKIDRSARNLRDWANLGDLIDRGVDIQFVHDQLDLQSRGGRLSADIQAVVAADYVRNLREEVRKGFYGRLKQGLYPLPAPVGYLDRGKGRPKEPDPVAAPLVREAFEMYANNRMSLRDLRTELTRRGLHSRAGGVISMDGLSTMLNNPFYMGIVRIGRTNETFPGSHQPLVSEALFQRVQNVLRGKTNNKVIKHDFIFRRFIRCGACGYHLVGERKKERYVYYRCFTHGCRKAVIREQDAEAALASCLDLVQLLPDEIADIGGMARELSGAREADMERQKRLLAGRLSKCEERLLRLTDALVDGLISKDVFEARRYVVLKERQRLLDARSEQAATPSLGDRVLHYLELQYLKDSGYRMANPSERRAIADAVTWNFLVHAKNPAIALKSPYQEIVNWRKTTVGGPRTGTLRTQCKRLFDVLMSAAVKESCEIAVQKERVAQKAT